ncbi:hypothetical protein BKA65DRAFT_557676 [Rhexocercosporidium sp. MPI-PUGE-AT-0058]|nr:hypothetical protein BKA65DRAFT_557676 [Rhexocercosporidium sp. MPI-PUGE-AT-0058]
MTSPVQQEACAFVSGSSPEFAFKRLSAGTNDRRDPTVATVETSTATGGFAPYKEYSASCYLEKIRRFEEDRANTASPIPTLGERVKTLGEERKWFQTSLARFKSSNEGLKAENERLQRELNTAAGVSKGESDMGGHNKRGREAAIEADLDTEGLKEKRPKFATGSY